MNQIWSKADYRTKWCFIKPLTHSPFTFTKHQDWKVDRSTAVCPFCCTIGVNQAWHITSTQSARKRAQRSNLEEPLMTSWELVVSPPVMWKRDIKEDDSLNVMCCEKWIQGLKVPHWLLSELGRAITMKGNSWPPIQSVSQQKETIKYWQSLQSTCCLLTDR